jgi:hypothetical protein
MARTAAARKAPALIINPADVQASAPSELRDARGGKAAPSASFAVAAGLRAAAELALRYAPALAGVKAAYQHMAELTGASLSLVLCAESARPGVIATAGHASAVLIVALPPRSMSPAP